MGDMGDLFNSMKTQKKEHRAKMLTQANTVGWTRHTEYHYSRDFNGKRMNWWPSAGKAQLNGKMIYGHIKVNAKIKQLIEAEIIIMKVQIPEVK